jgi:transcription elongation factor Elf1
MWLEQKYVGMMSNRLDRFKQTKHLHWNFRCPVCGDSQKNKYKARGWIFPKDKGGLLYHCHNCTITLGIDKLLETVDPNLYQEFIREKLQEELGPKKKTDVELFADKMKPPVFVKETPLKKLKKISQLAYDHPAKLYVSDRGIPNKYHSKLFYAPRFREFVRSIDINLMQESEYDEPRLIIPFLDEEQNLFGFQGRSFRSDGIRYLTIMIDKNRPKVFGLDTCDRNKTHFILEGPIDSMFVDNSIAMAGGSIDWSLINEYSVFVFDNEPRSKETCAKIEKIIDKGYKVVIFPEFIKSKDINDMIKNKETDDTNAVLCGNISSGLEAKIIYTAWKRI